ncbi:AEC family transporter [Primorskyibacter flagellatus]|uniref:AEC family transporter n=1 Tax=Primorskyibacter flagellatus TaxID=1387277 RepID=UPI003A93D59B
MLHVLTHNILPVFSMLALGFLLGRTGRISFEEARTLNRVAFLVLQPALIFPLIASVDFHQFDFVALAGYALCQAIAFTLAYLVARRLFGREHLESWLLAMCVVFVNTLLYIWPISFLIYGEAAALPITAIVAWDSAFSFAFFIITTDVMAGRSEGALRRVAGNPVLIAILLGAIVNLVALSLPEPLLTAARFAGAGAAPLTLLALGVILSRHALMPSPVILGISGLKLLGFPLLVWLALTLGQADTAWQPLLVLTAAGPSGAMAFSLAMLHGIRTDIIAPVVIWTSILSLISLSWLA